MCERERERERERDGWWGINTSEQDEANPLNSSQPARLMGISLLWYPYYTIQPSSFIPSGGNRLFNGTPAPRDAAVLNTHVSCCSTTAL